MASMNRIQRARALRLGFLVAAMVWASAVSAKPRSDETFYRPQGDNFVAVVNAEGGIRIVVVEPTIVRCEAKAELDYKLAELVGVDADAAWEDSFDACLHVESELP